MLATQGKYTLINLIYIQGTIREKTGQELSLPAVLKYLVEEGLVTPEQAQDKHLIFKGYSEYFEYDDYASTHPVIEDLPEEAVVLEKEDSQFPTKENINAARKRYTRLKAHYS